MNYTMNNNLTNRLFLKSHFDLMSGSDGIWINENIFVSKSLIMSFKECVIDYLFFYRGD